MLRNAERAFYREQFHSCRGNTAATWKLLRNMIPNKKLTSNNNIESELEQAEKFNDLFVNVGKLAFEKTQNELNIAHPHRGSLQQNLNYENFFRPEPVDVNTVILTIKHLKNTNSAGSDGMTFRYLQDTLPALITYITIIINTSIVTGKFPSAWKHATVISIFKNDDRSDVNNYRPVSLVPILSKILEKIESQQLSNFLQSNNLIANSQNGFRLKLSTETALLTFTNTIYSNMDVKKLSHNSVRPLKSLRQCEPRNANGKAY